MKQELLGRYPTTRSVCRDTNASSVRAVYEHAIEITSAPRGQLGWALLLPVVFLGLFGAIAGLSVPLMSGLLDSGGRGVVMALMSLPFLAMAWLGVGWILLYLWLTYWRRPFDLPQLYNRRTGTVYLLEESPSRELTWQRVADLLTRERRQRSWGVPTVRLVTVPWSALVVEDYRVTIYRGDGGRSVNRWLALAWWAEPAAAVTQATPDAATLRFNLGRAGAYLGPSTWPQEWEHVRRYMQHDGLALEAQHALAEPRGRLSWWGHLGASSAFGPGYRRFCREQPGLAAVIHLLAPVTLPLALLTATLGWLADRSGHELRWPEAVLQEAGALVTGSPQTICARPSA